MLDSGSVCAAGWFLSFVKASIKGAEETAGMALNPLLNSELHTLTTNIFNNFT